MPAPSSPGDHALDATADALARRLLDALPAGRAHARTAFATFPPPVARLLASRLDARVDREAPAPASDWVDADRARDGARAWQEAAREAARVPADAWEDFVVDACRLVVSHLVRPAETLAAVTFEDAGDDPLPAALVLRRLRAFAPYPYLPEIAGRYVERKELARIDRAGLERLLRRIDRRMVAGFSADEWAALLEPLLSLVGPVGTPEGTVPRAILEPFFEAKGLDDLADALAGQDAFTDRDVHARLARALPAPADAPALPAAPPPPEPEPPPAAEPVAPAPLAVDDAPAYELAPEEPVVYAEPSPDDEPWADEPAVGGWAAHEADEEEEAAPRTATGWQTTEPALSSWPDDPAALPPADPPPAEPPRSEPPTLRPPWFSAGPALSPIHGLGADEPEYDDGPSEAADAFEDDVPNDPEPGKDLEPADEPLWRRMMSTQDATFEDVDESVPDDEPEDEPLWKRFVSPTLTDSAPAPASDRGPALAPPAGESDGDLTDTLDRDEARVLGASTDGTRRAWFVAELFSGSEADYRDTLALLAGAPTWTDATQIIGRDVFRKHRVNIYSEAAVVFTDAVEARYRR